MGLLLTGACTSACQDEPREVGLRVSASAAVVTVCAPVVLYAERYYRGEWQQVEKASLSKEQCWLGRPPPDREAEVADNLRWQSSPAPPVRFNDVEAKPITITVRAP